MLIFLSSLSAAKKNRRFWTAFTHGTLIVTNGLDTFPEYIIKSGIVFCVPFISGLTVTACPSAPSTVVNRILLISFCERRRHGCNCAHTSRQYNIRHKKRINKKNGRTNIFFLTDLSEGGGGSVQIVYHSRDAAATEIASRRRNVAFFRHAVDFPPVPIGDVTRPWRASRIVGPMAFKSLPRPTNRDDQFTTWRLPAIHSNDNR